MSKFQLIAASVLVCASMAAQAQDRRPFPASAEASHSVPPVAAGQVVEQAEPRPVVPLRDSLRQSWSDPGDKPYRLSSEERQRMRAQLRAQSTTFDTPSK